MNKFIVYRYNISDYEVTNKILFLVATDNINKIKVNIKFFMLTTRVLIWYQNAHHG